MAQSWHRLPSDSARLAFLGVASYWTLTCCFSRLYMGVHSPLDVVSVVCVGCKWRGRTRVQEGVWVDSASLTVARGPSLDEGKALSAYACLCAYAWDASVHATSKWVRAWAWPSLP